MSKALNDIAFSMLDLVPVREGRSVADALAVSLQTAQHADRLGFTRYWLAEHHNMASIASSSTAVLIGHVAGGTERNRVGSRGGVAKRGFQLRHRHLAHADQLVQQRGLFLVVALDDVVVLVHQPNLPVM